MHSESCLHKPVVQAASLPPNQKAISSRGQRVFFLYFFQHSIFFKPSQMLSITNQFSLNIGDSLHLKRERANICTSYVHTLSPTLLERAISYFCMNSLNHKPCLEGGWAQLCMGIPLYLDIIKISTMSMTGFSFCFSIMIRY